MRFFLVVSVALNLLMLATMVAARVDLSRAAAPVATAGYLDIGEDTFSTDIGPIATASDLVSALQEIEIEPATVKLLTASWLEGKYLNSFAAERAEYWEPGFAPLLDELIRESEVDAAVRRELIAAFGADAAKDPAFDKSFRPLGPGYAFLGSEAQLALRAQQIRMLEAAAGSGAPGPGDGRCLAGDAVAANLSQSDAAQSGLGRSDENEYRLRFSQLSDQLRRSGVADNEAEFRELFDLLRQLERAQSPLDQARMRRELRASMGDEVLDGLLAMRDPFFASLKSLLVGQNFQASDIRAAYAVINRSHEESLEIIGRQGDRERIVSALSQVRQDELARLTQILGEKVARDVLMNRNRQVMEFAARDSRAC